MKNVALRNGKNASLDVWNYDQLKNFLMSSINLIGPFDKIDGFFYLGPDIYEKLDKNKDRYSEQTDLSQLEIQEQAHLPNTDYHRSIVATIDNRVRAALICEWTNECMFTEKRWVYRINWIDVQDDYKNLGLGTELVRALDESDFIRGKVVVPEAFSPEGIKHIKPVIRREMKAKDYVLYFGIYTKAPDHLREIMPENMKRYL